MRVLLTGATGFIGAHVARVLVEEGHDVRALVREGSNTSRLAQVDRDVELVSADLRTVDAALLRTIRPEVVLHLGWYAEPGKYLESPVNLELVSASLRLATAAADAGCARFVGIGTCFEHDTAAGLLSEGVPLRPTHVYSACKAGLGLMLEQLGAVTGMSVAWARIFYLYGPTEDPRRLVPSVIRALLRGEVSKTTLGEQVRDFLHVEDVAAALCAVARNDVRGAINVGSGVPVTVREVVTRIAAILGRPELVELGALPYNPRDPMFICADPRRLVAETGFRPRYDLASGLAQTIDWWRTYEGRA